MAFVLYPGRLDSSDEQMMAETSRSLAWHGSLRFEEMHEQTFTGYGIGAPLIGVPLAWIDGFLGLSGISPPALVALANAVLLGVVVYLVALVARGMRGAGMRGLPLFLLAVVVSSPVLPLALRFYSDLPAGAGVLAAAAGIMLARREGRSAWGVLSLAGAAFAIMARPSALPLLLLVMAWGFGERRQPRDIAMTLLGTGIGLAVRAGQNAVLRGSPFAHGYEGQEFVAPLATGLHGLVFSPERGLLVFWPLVGVLLVPRAGESRMEAGWRMLSLGGLIVSVVMHATFWTWHGGWTVGPRFVLPAIIVALPSVVLGVRDLLLSGHLPVRLTALALFAWSFVINAMHSLFHAPDAYRTVWNFHQVESRWLFEPQFGLATWVGLLASEGAWYPMILRWWAGSGPLAADGLLAVIFGVLLLVPCGVGLAMENRALLRRTPARLADLLGLREHRLPWVAVAVLVLAVGAAGFLRGERGLELESGERMRFARLAHIPAGSTVRFAALLDLAPHGDYKILGRVQGVFQVTIDGDVVVEGAEKGLQRHLFSGSFRQPSSGLRLLEVELTAPESEPGLIELYWSWPGEGVLMGPVGGEYVQPEYLTGMERLATRLWRQRWTIMAFAVSFLVLAGWSGKPRRKW